MSQVDDTVNLQLKEPRLALRPTAAKAVTLAEGIKTRAQDGDLATTFVYADTGFHQPLEITGENWQQPIPTGALTPGNGVKFPYVSPANNNAPLVVQGFGFNIPFSAEILGVDVVVAKLAGSAALTDAGISVVNCQTYPPGDPPPRFPVFYLAAPHSNSPRITIYERAASLFTKLANPAILPAQDCLGCTFSSDGAYLAVAGNFGTTTLLVYKRAADVFTKLANPDVMPSNSIVACTFSADGVYLTVSGSSIGVSVYKRTGDAFALLSALTGASFGGAEGVFSPDGSYLAACGSSIRAWTRAGDVFTMISTGNFDTFPSTTANGLCWSPDGVYLAMAENSGPKLTVYKRTGSVFAAAPVTIDVAPSSSAKACSFSPDGVYLAVAHSFASSSVGDFVTIYQRSGDAFTKVATLATPFSGLNGVGCVFDSTGVYLAVGLDGSPYVRMYSRSGSVFTLLSAPATLPTGPVGKLAFYPPAVSGSK